ncbi:L-aminopeptidase/D-esterase-like protein [Williamsia limnetica]|uniref:L-aminopeptidase/D-esterase-like protein n=1 Tax=Williamsia limnetica TaxID=882452 RepID=A0A318RVY9_WILLI|nr:P1 family peptidase [Williamsia limnetica]PYE13927.1 L-aminopeptidase/D-esterase-like protein [Williamsia limnetica]
MIPGASDSITDVAGVLVGHHHRLDEQVIVGTDEVVGEGWATGTTVVLLPDGAVAAVDVRGGGPGTRETDLLDPANTVQTAHAIVLSGGSAYGLAAADGVMTYLEDAGIGLAMDTRGSVVPIVPAAVIFDLAVGQWGARPDRDFGRRAALAAGPGVELGSVGAGTGARAGALKGGVGSASITFTSGPATGITVGAVVIANPVGAVVDPASGLPWGVLPSELDHFGLRRPSDVETAALAALTAKSSPLNTTIGVVATDAALDPASTRRVAMTAHDGLARAIRPAHSPLDGDTLFAVATGSAVPTPHEKTPAIPRGMNPNVALVAAIGEAAATVVHRAIVKAVIAATPVAGIPTYRTTLPSAFESSAPST